MQQGLISQSDESTNGLRSKMVSLSEYKTAIPFDLPIGTSANASNERFPAGSVRSQNLKPNESPIKPANVNPLNSMSQNIAPLNKPTVQNFNQ